MDKKVSVIVNCHNGEKFIKNCINSILNQKYKNFEIIFYNNFSDDNSEKIILSFKDKRIKYFYSKKKISLYYARNEALRFASGELIAFLDVDDWWDENYLSSRELQFHEDCYDFFYCNKYIYYEKRNKFTIYKKIDLPFGKIYKDLAKDYFVTISGLIIKKKVFNKIGLFNKNFNIIGDYEMVMKISKKFIGHAINKPLLFYRSHEKNFSKLNHEMFFFEYNQWFKDQIKLRDQDFLNNIKYFKKRLLYLEIKNLLFNKTRNFYLLERILKYPDLTEKFKFFLAFLIPKRILNHLQK